MNVLSDADHSDRLAPLSFGEATPDPVGFPDLERIGPALPNNGAHLAHSLGTHLSSLSFILAFLGAWREEEVGVVAAAQCNGLPGTVG